MKHLGRYVRENRWFLIIIFCLSLLMRMLFFYYYTAQGSNCMLAGDSDQYEEIALQIVQGNGISTSPRVVNFYETTNFYRLPGYPIFLAALYAILGPNRVRALAVQTVLASAIPILIFMLSMTLFPHHVLGAQCAAVMAMLYPGFVIYAGILATEAFFLILFLLFCIAFFSCFYVWAGVLLGLCSLVRPVGHYVLIMALGAMILNGSRVASLHSAPRMTKRKNNDSLLSSWGPLGTRDPFQCLTFLLAWLIIVTPWLMRNFLLTGYLFFHTLPGLHFLQYSAVGVVVERDHCSYFQGRDMLFVQWHEAVAQREHEIGKKLTEYEYYGLAGNLAFKTIMQHPLLACKHALTQLARTCGTLYSSILLYVTPGTVYDGNYSLWDKMKLYLFPNTVQPWLKGVVYLELVVALIMLIGFFLFLRVCFYTSSIWLPAFYLLSLSCFFIGITLSYGCARLRMQADAFLIILVGYGINFLIKKK